MSLSRDPEKQRAWRRRGARNYEDKLREEGRRFSDLDRSTPLRQYNPERKRRLRDKQFGEDDDKRDWTVEQRCEVTGDHRRIHPAHTKSRGAGGTAEHMVPLRWDVHHDFDHLPEAKFEAKWGRTKGSIRETAAIYHEAWLHETTDTD